jgi:hypothetical protein
MKNALYKILMLWGILIAITAILGKTTLASNNGRTTADFLNIGVGARAAGLGGAFTALADDPTAGYWNPAGLSSIDKLQLSISHFAWYQDLNYDYLGLAFPVTKNVTIGFSATYLNYGKIDGYDADDNPTGSIDGTSDMAGSFYAGIRLSDNISVGAGAKYIALSLANKKSNSIAADFGLKYESGRLIFGLSAANFGQKIKFDQVEEELPSLVRMGMAVLPFGNSLIASFDLEKQLHGDIVLRNGYELNFSDRYFVRAGYNYCPQQEDFGFAQNLSFGVGALLGPAQFDYTFSPDVNFSSESIHRFSVNLILGK